MDKDNYDILSPVNSENIFGRVFWILGSFISISILIFSFFFENAILIILDGLIPLTFFIYRLIKRKEYPFYYYFVCSSGLYFLYWLFFLSPDFDSGVIDESSNVYFKYTLDTLVIILSLFLFYKIITKYTTALKNNCKLNKIYLSVESVIVIVFILVTQFLTLNVVLDEPYKEDFVYITDIRYHKSSSYIYYKYSLNDKDEYVINSNTSYEPTLSSTDGLPMGRIECGKGAFGIEWKKIIE